MLNAVRGLLDALSDGLGSHAVMLPVYYAAVACFLSFLFLVFAPGGAKFEAAHLFGSRGGKQILQTLAAAFAFHWLVMHFSSKNAIVTEPTAEDRAVYYRHQRNLYLDAVGFVSSLALVTLSPLIVRSGPKREAQD
eukprot:GDKI01035940.1.p2 GENE.GDKI01035940.1~~GDKI01035940.1.p2  ORF type:complete len:136 (+),score=36.08 GDKI01035940.1:95-502(+)